MRLPNGESIEKLDEALRKQAALSVEEQLADMRARGVIDENGRVLLRGIFPQPPKKKRSKKNAPSNGSNGSSPKS